MRASYVIFPKTEPLHLLGRATHLSAVIVLLSIRQAASLVTLRTDIYHYLARQRILHDCEATSAIAELLSSFYAMRLNRLSLPVFEHMLEYLRIKYRTVTQSIKRRTIEKMTKWRGRKVNLLTRRSASIFRCRLWRPQSGTACTWNHIPRPAAM